MLFSSQELFDYPLPSTYIASHNSLADATADQADIFVTGLDLESSASHLPNLIVLNSLLDKEELKRKLKERILG